MTELRQNFSLIAGDTTDVDYGLVPLPDPPFDISQTNMSWTAYPQVRGIADKTLAVITKTSAAGGIEIEDTATYAFVIHLTTADTVTLAGNYFYEIVIIDPLNSNHRSTPTIGTMTVIDTADPLNVVAFKSMFPQMLEAIDDGVLQTALDEAALFIDDTWSVNDIPAATFYLAAHFIFTAQASSGAGGETISSERIGQISVSYAVAQSTGKTGGIDPYSGVANSAYGRMFLALMQRNSPAIMIV